MLGLDQENLLLSHLLGLLHLDYPVVVRLVQLLLLRVKRLVETENHVVEENMLRVVLLDLHPHKVQPGLPFIKQNLKYV